MIKKLALGVACLGLLFSANSVFACCEVDNPTPILYGYDIKVDVDVCIDSGKPDWFGGDYWDVQALIIQTGQDNEARITQASITETAGIIQEGSDNEATITQSGAYEYALIIQTPNASENGASITQSLNNAAALIIQSGSGNIAYITQD